MSARPRLRTLASRLGILDGYESALDASWIETLDSTREALCVALGFEAGTEACAEASLARLEDERRDEASVAADAPTPLCWNVDAMLGAEARRFGVWTNLYSLRSRRNMGFGDLGDLAVLSREVANAGGAFIGLNPLHALGLRTNDPSPYRPASRIFRDPLYIALDHVCELETAEAARRALDAPDVRARIDTLRRANRLDITSIRNEKQALLRSLHRVFRVRRGLEPDSTRARAFARYRREIGRALEDFATFNALAEHFDEQDWREWPQTYRDPRHPSVAEFRTSNAEAIDFHAWLQFEIDRQLESVASDARHRGLEIGLYTDLALGSDPSGSDAWTYADCFARSVTLGAPPDGFSREGQDWAIPPLIPRALQRSSFAAWRSMLRANLRHAGALRIDHAIGLRRQFWIPEGRPPGEGAYVEQPERALIDVIAEESRRAAALVIAEDLGTVPAGLSEHLIERGMLSSRVMLFEQDEAGFVPRDAYPRHCLATIDTHDLSTLDAWWTDGDLSLRRSTGQIPSEEALGEIRRSRRRERAALRRRLIADGVLDEAAVDPESVALAATRFLCETPAALVGLGLDDLAGEIEPINLPGVPSERHASWTRRMGTPIEDLPASPRWRAFIGAVPDGRRVPSPPLASDEAHNQGAPRK